jgi:hypothetical protein
MTSSFETRPYGALLRMRISFFLMVRSGAKYRVSNHERFSP